MNIPFFDYGGTGSPLHFLHANGYPPACYGPLLELLSISLSRLWDVLASVVGESNPAEIKDWTPFSDDLLKFLDENRTSRIIAMGHSIGATVTMRAGAQGTASFSGTRADRASAFPILFHVEMEYGPNFWPWSSTSPKNQGALKRRRDFDDLDQVFTGYRRRHIFRFLTDENLRIFIQGMTKPKAVNGEAHPPRAVTNYLTARNGRHKFTILAFGMIGISGWTFLGWIFQL